MAEATANESLTALMGKLVDTMSDRESKKDKNRFKNVTLVRQGTQIILPEGMDLKTARMWLERREEEEETVVNVKEPIDAFPLDGAHALMLTLKELYGWANLEPTPGFFGPTPPSMIGVPIGVDEMVQIPWGQIAIPGIEGKLHTGFTMKDERPIFELTATVKRKHEHVIAKIAAAVRKTLQTKSIYRGKAITISFRDSSGQRAQFNPGTGPKFMDLSKINPLELVFPDAVMAKVTTSLFNPVERTQLCRQHKIPLKRGVLLHGPYGTGKTLAAGVTATKCVSNGWTFIYGTDVRDLDQLLAFASMYQPCVIFAEDVDRAVGEKRDTDTDRILNTLDGIGAKGGNEIIVVLTSNEVDKIHKAMIRPGRIDAAIEIALPDAKAISKLVRLYGRDTVQATDEELMTAVTPLEGYNAAVVRECVEQSKLTAIGHLDEEDELQITAEDIKHTAESMQHHLSLLKEKPKTDLTPEEMIGVGIRDSVGPRLGQYIGGDLQKRLTAAAVR